MRRALELLRAELDQRSGVDRAAWSVALAALALPELFVNAGGGVSLGVTWKGLIQGAVVVNKPVAAIVTAVALVTVAAVAWFAGRDPTGRR